MRSRYSAYACANYDYILQTYGPEQRAKLSIKDLQQDPVIWCKLEVLHSQQNQTSATVEFQAYYQEKRQFYVLHELSNFCLEHGAWRYTEGTIFKDSGQFIPQRNDPCLCGSGTKYKKCCG